MGLASRPDEALLTVVVVPREKYSRVSSAVRAVLDQTGPPFELVVVDEARAPRRQRRRLAAEAVRLGFRHLALPHPAGVNECRMRGFELATTPYVLFMDNDAYLHAGALSALLAAGEASGASFVSPVCLNADGTAHHIGNVARLEGEPGARRLDERFPTRGAWVEMAPDLVPGPLDVPELHAVLIRASSLQRAGGMDDQLESSMDCVDLGLRLQSVDGGGRLEPSALVTYDASRPHLTDLPLYLARWAGATVDHDLAHFVRAWALDPAAPGIDHHVESLAVRRRRLTRYVRGTLRRTVGPSAVRRWDALLDRLYDRFSPVR